MKRTKRLALAMVSVAVVTACGSAVGDVTPNGAVDAPVTLTGISYNVTGRSGGDQLARFSELASQLSNGSITIEAGPEPDSAAPDTSADTIAMTSDGQADLAVVSARTFDTLGVTSFQALQAPYLITSNELADQVLADPIAEQMLSGTKALGLVGLGLAFDFLAYPGGFDGPLLSPNDYEGKGFQVRPSRANDLLVEALGGTPDPRNGPDLEAAVADGEVSGNWEQFNGLTTPVGGVTYTANEPTFLRANVFVINEKVYAGLSGNQQQALKEAATQTRDWMAAQHTDPAVMAEAYCANGYGDIAMASSDQMRTMHEATAPVVTALETQELTRAVVARIRELSETVAAPPPPSACSAPSTSIPIRALDPAGDQKAIDGVWRHKVDKENLLDSGVSELDATNNSGTWTWTFDAGRYQSVEPGGSRTCEGSYVLNGNKFLLRNDEVGCDLILPLEWSRQNDRLIFQPWPGHPTGRPLAEGSQLMTPDEDWFAFFAGFFQDPLTRVGDAP